MSNAPLNGLKVVDFTQGVAGPLATMLLGDLGATVWKIEPARGDWIRTLGRPAANGESPIYLGLNRNKQGLCLDLKHERGLEAAAALARQADVVVESFRPGVMERFGLGYDALRAQNRALVYASVNGWGREGPYVDLPASDYVLQAMAGVMSVNGEPGREPLRVGWYIVDMVTGMHAHQGILTALLARGTSGEGQHLNVSLLDSIVHFQMPVLMDYLVHGEQGPRTGNVNPAVAPSQVYATADGYLQVSVFSQHWQRFCEAVGLPALADDPRFATNADRLAHRDALNEQLTPRLRAEPTATWLERLRGAGILCAPINDYAAVARDPQVMANELLFATGHARLGPVPVIRHPVRYGAFDPAHAAPPTLGEHTRAVLTGAVGLAPADVDALAADGAVLCGDGAAQ